MINIIMKLVRILVLASLIQRGIIRLHPTFEFKKNPKNQNVVKQGKKKIIIIKIKIKTEERKRKREERLNTLYIC